MAHYNLKKERENWFRFRYYKLMGKLKKEYNTDYVSKEMFRCTLKRLGLNANQIYKIYAKYYISKEQMDLLNDYIDNKEITIENNETIKEVVLDNFAKEIKYVKKNRKDICSYIIKNYKTYKKFADENITELDYNALSNYRNTGYINKKNAISLYKWYITNKIEESKKDLEPNVENSVKNVENNVEKNVEKDKTLELAKCFNIGNKVIIDKDTLNIMLEFIKDNLSKEQIERIELNSFYRDNEKSLNSDKVSNLLNSFDKNIIKDFIKYSETKNEHIITNVLKIK